MLYVQYLDGGGTSGSCCIAAPYTLRLGEVIMITVGDHPPMVNHGAFFSLRVLRGLAYLAVEVHRRHHLVWGRERHELASVSLE
jgi:hypothetical protein